MNRTRVSSSEIQAGDIIDGQLIGVPEYYRLTGRGLRGLPWLRNAERHLAVDRDAGRAREKVTELCGVIRRIARAAGARGCHVTVHAPSSCSGCGETWNSFGELWAVIWITRDNRIVHRVIVSAMYGSIQYRFGRHDCDNAERGYHSHGTARYATQLLRRLDARSAKRRAARVAARIAAYDADQRALADALRPVLGAEYEADGWLPAPGGKGLETSHDYALGRDVDALLRSVGYETTGGGTLGLSSAVMPIRRIEAA